MDDYENSKPQKPILTIILVLAVILAIPVYTGVSKLIRRQGMRPAVSDFEKNYPTAKVLETTYTGSMFHPDTVTVYAYDSEYSFTFITEYARQDGTLVRSEDNAGNFSDRLGTRRSVIAVTEIIPQYLKAPYFVRYLPDNSPGFFLVTEEKGHDTLLMLYNALRDQIERLGTEMTFAIDIPEETLYARIQSSDFTKQMCDNSYYLKQWSKYSCCTYPVLSIAAETTNCHSVYIDYVTDTEQGFARMEKECDANTPVLQARELLYLPDRSEVIMAVYVNN